jgi:hypothetical protein
MKPSIGRFRAHLRCNSMISGVAVASIAMMLSSCGSSSPTGVLPVGTIHGTLYWRDPSFMPSGAGFSGEIAGRPITGTASVNENWPGYGPFYMRGNFGNISFSITSATYTVSHVNLRDPEITGDIGAEPIHGTARIINVSSSTGSPTIEISGTVGLQHIYTVFELPQDYACCSQTTTLTVSVT